MSDTQRMRKSTLMLEGLLAGLLLALTDWVASGVQRTPLAIVLFSTLTFALGGLFAGLLAAPLRRRGLAVALATGGALAIHGLSIVSKQLGGAELGSERRLVATACLIFALHFGAFAGWGFARALRRANGSTRAAWLGVLVAACGVPAASLVGKFNPEASIQLAVAAALPFPLVGWFLARFRFANGALALGLLVLLALPVALYDHEPPRRFLPGKSGAVPAADAPNVVLFVVDTVRADEVEPERTLSKLPGDRTAALTPALNALAAGGARFTQSISSASWTLPATSSLLTSLYPSQHGAVMKTTTLPGEVVTLAEVFHKAGYETAAFTGGAFVSPAYGLDQGFEYFDHLAEFNFRPFRFHTPLAWRLAKNRFLPLRALLRLVNEFGGMRAVNARVNEWLDQRSSERPFFLLVHTYQVHDYYIYHPEPDDELLATLAEPSERFSGRLSVHPSELLAASASDLAWFQAIYENRLHFVDARLGELLASLEAHAGGAGASGANLVTAMTSDHGEGFDAVRHRVHHGERLHDDLLRVPLILSAPGRIAPGTRIDEQVRSVDLMPTLIDLAGLELPSGLAGQSLLPALDGEGAWPGEAFGEEIQSDRRKLALRTAAWKLIRGTGSFIPSQDYDLAKDPKESRAPEQAPPKFLLESLGSFRQRYSERPREESAIDEATENHLRSLGYIE